jgi:hypothetical protein
MDTNYFAVAILGLLFLFIFLTGYFLSRSGKPFNFLVLTIHKIISLATLVYLSSLFYQVPLNSLKIGVIAATGIFFVGAIITGGLLSTNKAMPIIVHRLHQITPWLTVLSTAAMLFLLFGS